MASSPPSEPAFIDGKSIITISPNISIVEHCEELVIIENGNFRDQMANINTINSPPIITKSALRQIVDFFSDPKNKHLLPA